MPIRSEQIEEWVREDRRDVHADWRGDMTKRRPLTLADKRTMRRVQVRCPLTTREHAAALVLAKLAGKSLPQFVADLVSREVIGFEKEHPDVIEKELRKMLKARGEA